MVLCPDCGHDNIDGADSCQQCGQPLFESGSRRAESDLERNLLEDRIGRLNVRKPLLASPGEAVGDVMRRLAEAREGYAVVVDSQENILGVFTDRDALMEVNVDIADKASLPVSQFMTANVDTLAIEDRIVFVLHRMDVGGYRHVPILVDGRLAGIVSVRDVLEYLRAHLSI